MSGAVRAPNFGRHVWRDADAAVRWALAAKEKSADRVWRNGSGGYHLDDGGGQRSAARMHFGPGGDRGVAVAPENAEDPLGDRGLPRGVAARDEGTGVVPAGAR